MKNAELIAGPFDLANLPESFVDNAYPVYQALREHAPIKWMPDGSVFLTRYADLPMIYKAGAEVSSDKHREFRPKLGNGLVYNHHTSCLDLAP